MPEERAAAPRKRLNARRRLLAAGLLGAATAAAAAPSERRVEGHSVISRAAPAARITVPADARYVGTQRWVLAQYADDIELHAFVEAGAERRVRRLYWVQFEAYLPSRPELRHTYTSRRRVTAGGLVFLIDSWVEPEALNTEGDSDSAHLHRLLASAGYTLPRGMRTLRLVHLMDGARRELMVIYSEDPALTAAAPGAAGDAALLEHALQRISFE